MVMPRSRSWSLESNTRSTTAWWAAKVPVARRMASTRVVLPWSTWATRATLRSSAVLMVSLCLAPLDDRAHRERAGAGGGASLRARVGPASISRRQSVVVVVLGAVVDEIVMKAPGRVLRPRLGPAFGAGLHLDETNVVELERRRGVLDRARFFV